MPCPLFMGMEKTIRERVTALLPEIKKLIFAEEAPAPVEVEAAKVVLVDGTEVTVSPALEVGATATVVGPDGNEIPAPDGEHEVQDGTVFKVEGGVITEVKPIEAAPEAAPAPAEDMVTAAKAQEIAAAAVAPIVARLAKAEAINKQMYEVLAAMAEVPKDQPTEPQRNPFAKQDKGDIMAKLAAARAKIN
jgi:hypothetical protein